MSFDSQTEDGRAWPEPLTTLLERCAQFDPGAGGADEWAALDAELMRRAQQTPAGETCDAPAAWRDYYAGLAAQAHGDHDVALARFGALRDVLGDDWRVMYRQAVSADATRKAANMALAEQLHWHIQELRPDFEPSRRFISDQTARYAFHGDPQYQAMVRALLDCPGVSAFVETGTFLGRSTAFAAGANPEVPVFTAEINEEYFDLARRRLQAFPNVSQYLMHSADFMRRLVAEEKAVGDFPVFFLDAHWYEDWPLVRELELIRGHCPRAIVVIDDFKVPGQPQFPYDNYGGEKVCGLDAVAGHLPDSARHCNLFPRYSRDAVPDYITWAGYAVFFIGAEDVYERVARLERLRPFFFTYDVNRQEQAAVEAPGSEGAEAAAASGDEIVAATADMDFPFLVSFPRTGSHWLRMALERYFDRPLLTRSFFDHGGRDDYLLLHSHDMDMNLVRRNVLYLHRDPVDTVFSQLSYHGEDCFAEERVAYWADLYGQHVHKWLDTEDFTQRKCVLSYEAMRDDPAAELGRAIEHLGGTVDAERIGAVLAGLDKGAVKERTGHDPRVVADKQDYAQQRAAFRERMGEAVWSRFLCGRPALASRFGRSPVAAPADYAPATHPRQPWEYRKIIGLLAGKNEAPRLAFCLRALATYCDTIVYFDDNSEDDSVAIVEALAQECRVEGIIRKTDDRFQENIRREVPFSVGRQLGGTHFVVIDADEAFTANCLDGDFLRRRILSLAPGDSLEMPWIQLWRSVTRYRDDASQWSRESKAIAFADDGACAYEEKFIHLQRVPAGLAGKRHRLEGRDRGLLHFQFVNWRNLLVKQAWYRCLERVNEPDKPAQDINALYAPSKDETDLGLAEAPYAWFCGYPFLDARRLEQAETWRERQVLAWFEQFGAAYFQDLDIWDVDWGVGVGREPVAVPAAVAHEETDRWVAQAEACYAAGDLEGARDHLARALERDPLHLDAINDLGVLLWAVGDATGAAALFTRALTVDPASRPALLNACRVLQAAGRPVDARDLLRDLMGCHEGDTELGELKAVLDAESEAGEAPRQAELLNARAEELAGQGRLGEAKACLSRALEHRPDDAEILNNLGAVCWSQGDEQGALDALGRALELEPGNEAAATNLGAIRAALADRPQAVTVDEPLVHLVSYPRSGNTLMRTYLRGLLGTPWYSVYPGDGEHFDRQQWEPDWDQVLVIKDHQFRPEYRNVIYLVRDGRDAVLSLAYYMFMNGDSSIDRIEDFPQFLERIKNAYAYGFWGDHVSQALALAEDRNVLFVRYEDLQRDPVGTLSDVMRFLRKEVPADVVQRVVDETKANKKYRSFKGWGFDYQPDEHSLFRPLTDNRGGSNWADVFDARARAAFEAVGGTPPLLAFGYAPAEDWWRAQAAEPGAAPAPAPESLHRQAASLNAQAEDLAEQGRFEEAKVCLLRALEHEPADAEILNNLGAVYWAQGDEQGALEALGRALAEDPGHAEAAANLAAIRQAPATGNLGSGAS